jgi:hypothetical protein
MGQRGRQSFEKRQREMDRKDRARAKEERRQERREATDDEGEAVDEAALIARFQRLAERHAAGEIDDERFEERKREIFGALGLEVD